MPAIWNIWRENQADKPARAARMSAETIQFWTRIVNIAASHIKPGLRPRDIRQWPRTLAEVLKVPPFIGQAPPYRTPYNSLDQALDDIAPNRPLISAIAPPLPPDTPA